MLHGGVRRAEGMGDITDYSDSGTKALTRTPLSQAIHSVGSKQHVSAYVNAFALI